MAWHLQPQPCRSGLQQRHVALAPYPAGQQLDRFGNRHPESFADGGRIGDASLLQLPANRHTQTDADQAVLAALALLGAGEFRLGWLRLAHACQVVEVRPVVTWGSAATSAWPDV